MSEPADLRALEDHVRALSERWVAARPHSINPAGKDRFLLHTLSDLPGDESLAEWRAGGALDLARRMADRTRADLSILRDLTAATEALVRARHDAGLSGPLSDWWVSLAEDLREVQTDYEAAEAGWAHLQDTAGRFLSKLHGGRRR